ncbi:MAG: sigma factor-like helix-turn-helix DNA-binding protein [Ignavibacteriota bacterium]
MLSLIPDDEENLPSGLLERSELERLLAEGIDGLPKVEKTILSLYYKEELTLREIGDILDMHISRVSELKTQAIPCGCACKCAGSGLPIEVDEYGRTTGFGDSGAVESGVRPRHGGDGGPAA